MVNGNIKAAFVFVFNDKIVTAAVFASLKAPHWFSQNTVSVAFPRNRKLITRTIGFLLSFKITYNLGATTCFRLLTTAVF